MCVINGAALTTFEVSADGSLVSINGVDLNSLTWSLVLPADCLRALIMSLPEMMGQALRRRYKDPSLRLVYPLVSWRLETSTEPEKLILALSTSDGFEVMFAVDARELAEIADAAKGGRHARKPPAN